MRINNIAKLVYEELSSNVRSRKDDMYLYLCVCTRICGWQVQANSFGFVMKNYKALGIPNYETVRRSRAKIQAEHPELRDEETAKFREQKRAEYMKYVMGEGTKL